jgi:hypothetical protein
VTSPHRLRLDDLAARGSEILEHLSRDAANPGLLDMARTWQRDCATLVNELSGGSKAHWLSREYSEALLVRSPAGRAVEDPSISEIVGRVLHVLDRAAASLARLDANPAARADTGPRRFDFVHDAALRPVLEAAYVDSRAALEQGHFGVALITACGLLEALVTDALIHAGPGTVTAADGVQGPIAGWPFEARIASAERAGLIRGGCARLPPVARRYRDLADANGDLRADVTVAERDARLAGQVLHVIMRDLNPGR